MLEHEIPKGSRLYFGKKAKQKRDLEYIVSEIFFNEKFEEILTPYFSYFEDKIINDSNQLIKISDEDNNQLSLRSDSSLDVVRIITKRLGRTTKHKKWFYIQPIFSYPSYERYQIGCECIEDDNISNIINLTSKIVEKLNISPLLQISNINIVKLVCNELNLDIDLFTNSKISTLFDLNINWLNILLRVNSIDELKEAIVEVPISLKEELIKLEKVVTNIKYKNISIAPLYNGSMKYYDDIYYRFISSNLVLSNGGSYKTEGVKSLGFALYTDNLLEVL
jgi:histidyl-tRNA synthetase